LFIEVTMNGTDCAGVQFCNIFVRPDLHLRNASNGPVFSNNGNNFTILLACARVQKINKMNA
jgi:hypothetical protein